MDLLEQDTRHRDGSREEQSAVEVVFHFVLLGVYWKPFSLLLWKISFDKTRDKNSVGLLLRDLTLLHDVFQGLLSWAMLSSEITRFYFTFESHQVHSLQEEVSGRYDLRPDQVEIDLKFNLIGPISLYENLLRDGTLSPDDFQKSVVNDVLQPMWVTLNDYKPHCLWKPPDKSKGSFLSQVRFDLCLSKMKIWN